MNRAMRRAASRAKPLEYQRVDLPRHLDELAVFGDIERVLEKIEHGEIEFSQGVPVMLASDGGWYEVIPALNGWISVWKAFDQKFQLGHDLSALVRLCNCLNYNQPLREDQVRAAKTVLTEQRRLFRTLPRDQIASAAKTEQIRMLMEDRA